MSEVGTRIYVRLGGHVKAPGELLIDQRVDDGKGRQQTFTLLQDEKYTTRFFPHLCADAVRAVADTLPTETLREMLEKREPAHVVVPSEECARLADAMKGDTVARFQPLRAPTATESAIEERFMREMDEKAGTVRVDRARFVSVIDFLTGAMVACGDGAAREGFEDARNCLRNLLGVDD